MCIQHVYPNGRPEAGSVANPNPEGVRFNTSGSIAGRVPSEEAEAPLPVGLVHECPAHRKCKALVLLSTCLPFAAFLLNSTAEILNCLYFVKYKAVDNYKPYKTMEMSSLSGATRGIMRKRSSRRAKDMSTPFSACTLAIICRRMSAVSMSSSFAIYESISDLSRPVPSFFTDADILLTARAYKDYQKTTLDRGYLQNESAQASGTIQ